MECARHEELSHSDKLDRNPDEEEVFSRWLPREAVGDDYQLSFVGKIEITHSSIPAS